MIYDARIIGISNSNRIGVSQILDIPGLKTPITPLAPKNFYFFFNFFSPIIMNISIFDPLRLTISLSLSFSLTLYLNSGICTHVWATITISRVSTHLRISCNFFLVYKVWSSLKVRSSRGKGHSGHKARF